LLEDFMREPLPFSYFNRSSIAVGFGKCYWALGEYKRAEQYFLENVAWAGKEGKIFESFACRFISEFYVNTAQYAKAAPFLKRTAASAAIIPPDLKMQLYLMQFKVDSARGHYPSAMRHYQRYTALKDSLLNETTSRQMAELDVKYQTRQKEQALKLRQKDIRLLTQQRKTQQTLRNALLCGTLLLLALLGLSYNRYRLKRRSNRLLQAQQQEISRKNENLQQLLTEKDRLLKEIHHRVKNNLQVIMSLLNSQADSLTDQAALSAIQESQHRVQAISLIHQKLYQAEGLSRIPMEAYIEELVDYLQHFYDLPQPVRFQLGIDPVELDVAQAIPLGLIINEALTNALKYAFRDGRSGTVRLSLRCLARSEPERNLLKLTIEDDGVGLPADYSPGQSGSLGMTLMLGLSEQLGGALRVKSRPGLTITLTFSGEPQPAALAHTSYN
ncbi:MAG TPA: sensor histidine kinase, partial [Cytophagales bacterium]